MRAAVVGTAVACAVGAAVAPVLAPALADVKAGVDAWQQGDYPRAVAEWRPLATAGDADAQFNLGQAYKLGRGVPTDLPVALSWFKKAADQGHLRASDNYGLLLFQQGQRESAMPFIRKSADRGEPRAQYILGTALFNGDLAAKDWVTAYALMTRAASAGLEQATNSLAVMDKYIPEEQRRQGLAMAADMSKPSAKPAPAYALQKPLPVPVARPSAAVPVADKPATPKPAPVRESPRKLAVADVPPSTAAPKPTSAPAPVPAPAPEKAAKAGGHWRIQLGAFKEEPRARALWTSISARVSKLANLQPYLVRGNGVTRLQAGPVVSEAEAARLCAAVQGAGQDCLVKHD